MIKVDKKRRSPADNIGWRQVDRESGRRKIPILLYRERNELSMARYWGKMLKPLSPEEKKFAEQYHPFVLRYLTIYKLPASEWYDVAIFGYLRAVRDWLSMPKLHKYQFSTIAFKNMSRAVCEERNYQYNWWLDCQSLDESISDSDGDLLLSDTVTAKNMRYTHYVEAYKEPVWFGNTMSDETRKVLDFLKEGTAGVSFQFDSEKKADTKAESLRSFRARYGMQKIYNVFRSGCTVYVSQGPQFNRLEAYR